MARSCTRWEGDPAPIVAGAGRAAMESVRLWQIVPPAWRQDCPPEASHEGQSLSEQGRAKTGERKTGNRKGLAQERNAKIGNEMGSFLVRKGSGLSETR